MYVPGEIWMIRPDLNGGDLIVESHVQPSHIGTRFDNQSEFRIAKSSHYKVDFWPREELFSYA